MLQLPLLVLYLRFQIDVLKGEKEAVVQEMASTQRALEAERRVVEATKQ